MVMIFLDGYLENKRSIAYKSPSEKSDGLFCTRGRGRTGTLLLELDFESSASTNSATRAKWDANIILVLNILLQNLRNNSLTGDLMQHLNLLNIIVSKKAHQPNGR